VIVASHDEAVIQRLGRRVVRLERGEVVSDSNPCLEKAAVLIERAEEADAVRST